MSSIWLVAGIVVLVGFFLALSRNRSREVELSQLEHCIRVFVQMKKDGGVLAFEHARTALRVRLIRQNERNVGCDILVQLPTPKWNGWQDLLRLELERQLFEPKIGLPDGTNVLELTVAVPDINAPEAGARAARALVLIFGVAGLGSEERFRVTSAGENSIRVWRPAAERWMESGSPLLKKVGKSTLRGLEEERTAGDGMKDEAVSGRSANGPGDEPPEIPES